ncbi:hypothetical protein N9V29_00085 [Flavobacteriales bacterium]|nr:hypothetical protein [Flavobacteriales bacterium]
MRSNLDILSRSWDALNSKWLLAIGLVLLHGILNSVIGSVGFGLGTLALSGALSFGLSRTMVLIYRGHTPQFETYFDGFKHFLPTLVAFLLVSVIVLVGFVLLIIPGIIAAIGLSQTFYVLQDRPELGAEGAIRESWRLTWTNGNMLKVFFMSILSALVALGGLLVLGVGLLFAIPLVSVMAGGLYEELRVADGQAPHESGRVEFV